MDDSSNNQQITKLTDQYLEYKSAYKSGSLQYIWFRLCDFFVRTFYRRIEISGSTQLEHNGPIILCANHYNALADAVLLQYTSNRLIHPIARSGLFKNPFLKPILSVWQAIPVYRRQDAGDDQVDNDAMFSRVFEMLSHNQVLMIFPEGQSHADQKLRDFKTGVARIALGYKKRYGSLPRIVPVGLNFSHSQHFRSNVFINFGEPLIINENYHVDSADDVYRLTDEIKAGLAQCVLQVKEIEEMDFARQLERFFNLRRRGFRKKTLNQRFRSLKLILKFKNRLRQLMPEEVDRVQRHLSQFNRTCKRLGINDYNLNVRYDRVTISRFTIKSILVLLLLFPLGMAGFVSSFLPYILTRTTTKILATKPDQIDTVKILSGCLFFVSFWSYQVNWVGNHFGTTIMVIYLLSLIPTSILALGIFREQAFILDNLRVFITLIRHKKLRPYLLRKRKKLEKELAALINAVRATGNS